MGDETMPERVAALRTLAREHGHEAVMERQWRLLAEESISDHCETEARLTAALARVEALEAALTPSANTKAAYIGEFSFRIEEENRSRLVTVPWDNIKEIMAAIRARALLDGGPDDA